ncbi:fructose-specific PTS transporter subunit EIIC [Corynebacterium sp. H127]|uniref:PTS fructose transporter subunit IIABC n=1 Tax=Corynebacterium sp. H127 TaxID=3133418 RepID=UPI003099E5E2
MTAQVISTELVSLDQDFGTTAGDVIKNIVATVATAGRTTAPEVLQADAEARESKSPTGFRGRIAIPHCRTSAVSEPTLAFARLQPAADFGGPDGDADLIFLIAAPEGSGKAHLKILSTLARALVKDEFAATLRSAQTEAEIVDLVNEVLHPQQQETKAAPAAGVDKQVTRLVAITACPTGIAHTYMAADSLTQAAGKREDVEINVETQGSSAVTPLPADVIESADAVIFATDVGVKDRERFAGKPVIESGVKRAINEPEKMLDEAVAAAQNPNAHRVSGTTATTDSSESASKLGWGKRIQQAVMTGVSYMVPFVAAGGLLLALGFLIGDYDMASGWKEIATGYSFNNLPGHTVAIDGVDTEFRRAGLALYLGAVLFATGQAAMGFIVAALSGYTAYALAGRPGIAPGFVGGAISVTLGAGFIGGLITGIMAGLIAYWIENWKVPRIIQSLMPVVIIPLLTSLAVGLVMFLFLGRPLAAIMEGLQTWLGGMAGSSAVVLGIVLGLMMCFDLGGPVNKAAYLFATAGLSTGDQASLEIMAAVMAAGMVPPIALSLATFVRKQLFTPAEQENGKSAWLLGLSFISEGAIPFAAADPLRVIPSMMLGGAVTGAISMGLSAGSHAPHGGLFVLFAINPAWAWLLAIVVGSLVSAVAVVAMKQFWPNKAVAAANA